MKRLLDQLAIGALLVAVVLALIAVLSCDAPVRPSPGESARAAVCMHHLCDPVCAPTSGLEVFASTGLTCHCGYWGGLWMVHAPADPARAFDPECR